MTPANVTANINLIPMLTGSNFKSWQKNLLIVLGFMDLDLAIRKNAPAPLTAESTSDKKREIERWERSNRMCLMIMKKSIPEAFRGTISVCRNFRSKFSMTFVVCRNFSVQQGQENFQKLIFLCFGLEILNTNSRLTYY